MAIEFINIRDLRKMTDKEGLILQGCGGDLQEWLDGINQEFEKKNIFLNGTKFLEENCRAFNDGDITCLLFTFDNNVNLNISRLALWRIGTHADLGGSWLSDYVDNRLGGFLNETEKFKPDCKLIGEDGNIFNLIGLTSRCLRENGMKEEAKEMTSRVTSSGSYAEALSIISEYVNITGYEEAEDLSEDDMFCSY